MKGKIIVTTVALVMLGVAGQVLADNNLNGGGGTTNVDGNVYNLWSDAGNWSGGVPQAGTSNNRDRPQLRTDGYIDYAAVAGLHTRLGFTGYNNVDLLIATNGSLTVGTGALTQDFIIGYSGATGGSLDLRGTLTVEDNVDVSQDNALKINGGSLNADQLIFNDTSSGVMSNGSVTLAKDLDVGAAAGQNVSLGIHGTTLDIRDLRVGRNGSTGTVSMTSGNLNLASDLIVGNNGSGNDGGGIGSFDLTGGSVVATETVKVGGGADTKGTLNIASGASMSVMGNGLLVANSANTIGFVTNNGTLNIAGNLTVATDSNSVGTFVSVAADALDIGGNVLIATGEDSIGKVDVSNLVLSPGGNLVVATGKNSDATLLHSGGPIALNSTNGLVIGTGEGSTHNLTSADFAVTGPLGDFSVGAGTGASITDMINQNDSIGHLTVNTALDITAKDHQLTGLTKNADLTFSGGTRSLIGGGALNVADDAGTTASLVLSDLNPVAGVTLTEINVGNANGANASFSMDGEVVNAGVLRIGTGTDSVGTFSLDSGVVNVANAINIGSIDGTGAGTLTMNAGSISAGDMAIRAAGNVFLNDGLLTITNANSLTMAAGSSLFFGEGMLVWSNIVDAASMIDGFVTDGLITWSSTTPEFFGPWDARYENGSGSALFVVVDGGATTVFAAIPEPATLGMILAAGGGLLFIRRRLRM